ncbi:hypothetical protein GQF61_04135 [Sphingobacterium sp. DK4209]|uniref:HNH nuclease domain-containing protein n=1 Tax=Sphingobacterium zhuxiongii TaxID=2662364 RepID=A0A5Q0Q7N4_9SPHI|nr:hypothetical protein [Sphingobacterium sp. DK4209]QGA25366.1 hypothetical protein GFH32_03090 [Sphingobacterium sp. dk4302]
MISVLNQYSRYQRGLSMEDLFPKREDNTCACGCGNLLYGRKRKWYSQTCMHNSLTQFQIIKGDTSVIREELFKLDGGFCRSCGVYDEKWQADHILSVSEGGAACSLDNFQTLCSCCHKEKTKALNRIPNSSDVFASGLNLSKFPLSPFGTNYNTFSKHVKRRTVIIA